MGSTVRTISRLLTLSTFLVLASTAHAARIAASNEEAALDANALMQLETRAETAQPREQCFLYTELVHNLTEIAGRQLAQGDSDLASITLKHIASIAQKIHMSLARDTKKLKSAELMLHHTTRRLSDMVHVASSDDRPVLQSTLQRLDAVQSELLAQVFAH